MPRFCIISLLVVSALTLNIVPQPNEATIGTEHTIIDRCSIQFETNPQSYLQSLNEVYQPFFMPSTPCLANVKPSFVIHTETLNTSEPCKDEFYELSVTKEGAKLTGACPVGVIHAFATLIQIFGSNNEAIVLDSLPIHIKDSPRFSHRGLLIDTARRFLSKKIIFRLIDGMMLGKLNVLHWHLTDDDSFPMYSRSYPDLAKDGAFGPDMIYTPEDIKEIIDYADKKGIRVVPDLDALGHVRAIGLHKPLNDLITCFNHAEPYNVENLYRIRAGPPTGHFDPSMDKTYDFLRGILKDLTSYFKDELVHLGGDEIKEACWDERPKIREFMKAHNLLNYDALKAYFFAEEKKILKQIDPSKKSVYWVSENEFTVKYQPDAILQYWGESKNMKRLKSLYPKNKFIMSPCDYAYLDSGYENPYGGIAQCGVFKTWARMYNFEPTNYDLPEDRILGGEACAWSEVVNEDNLETKVWPRTAAYAAVLWEPKRTDIANLPKLVQDLNNFSVRLKEIGARTSPITGKFCELAENICFVKWP